MLSSLFGSLKPASSKDEILILCVCVCVHEHERVHTRVQAHIHVCACIYLGPLQERYVLLNLRATPPAFLNLHLQGGRVGLLEQECLG